MFTISAFSLFISLSLSSITLPSPFNTCSSLVMPLITSLRAIFSSSCSSLLLPSSTSSLIIYAGFISNSLIRLFLVSISPRRSSTSCLCLSTSDWYLYQYSSTSNPTSFWWWTIISSFSERCLYFNSFIWLLNSKGWFSNSKLSFRCSNDLILSADLPLPRAISSCLYLSASFFSALSYCAWRYWMATLYSFSEGSCCEDPQKLGSDIQFIINSNITLNIIQQTIPLSINRIIKDLPPTNNLIQQYYMQLLQEMSPEELIESTKKSRWFGIHKGDVDQFLVYHNIGPKKEKDDQAYQDPVVRNNFRRGLTIIEEVAEDLKTKELKIARKGLRKFQYLYPEFLDEDVSVGKHMGKLKNEFLESAGRFKGAFRVNVLEKLNGQNCQISFSHGHWIICSKNGVLFIKKGNDIPWKDKHMYGFRLEIAQLWFSMISQMKPQLLKELEKELETKTMIGEYCDSFNHQHIVKYAEKQIVFYSIVEKNSSQNCLVVTEAFQFFKRFELKTARVFMSKQVPSTEKLYELLYDVYKNVTKASIEEVGEGGVVYIEGVDKNSHSSILSLWKIKSMEYMILRKLREKLSQYLKKYRKSTKNILRKYIEEIKEMAGKFKPHEQLETYIQLAQKSFVVVENGSNLVLKFVLSRFISFLEFVRKNHQNPVEEFYKIIKGATNELDKVEVEEEDSDNEGKQEGKGGERETEGKKGETPPVQQISKKLEELNLLKKKIVILIPLTIPASGKSTSFAHLLTDKDIMVQIVSSDKCREMAMNELRVKNKKASHSELFDKSAKNAKNIFTKEITKAFNKLESSKAEQCLLILDKNHPPSAVESTLKDLKGIMGKYHKDVKIVALTPEITNPLEEKGKYSYPFSIEYLVTCLKRVLNRETHETLIGEPRAKAHILLGFMSLYRGFRFNSYNLSKHFDYELKMRMFNPEVSGITPEIINELTQIVISKKPGDFGEHPLVPHVLELLEGVKINEIPFEELSVENFERIKGLFQKFDDLVIEKKEKIQT